MLRFFRQVRQRLLAENRIGKFLVYVIVEIFIVIIGILIAIEVDNWNQEQSQESRFNFGIEKVYDRILADFYFWETYQDRAAYQISVIDSLLIIPDSIPPNRILGNLLVLDELVRDWAVNEEYYLDYFEFYPTDSFQFEILERVRIYFYGSWGTVRKMYITNEDESFKRLLRNQNIPVCDLEWGTSFRYFINECSKSTFSSEYYGELKELISSKEVRYLLHMLRDRCSEMLVRESTPGSDILIILEDAFEFLDNEIKTMEILGSGTPLGIWQNGVEMKRVTNQPLTWECEITLKDGAIRFRTKDRLDFSWGQGQLIQDQLTFGGPHIPVKAGKYHVIINLSNKTFEINPL